MFLLIGIIDIFAQGYLSGKLIPKLGETKLALIGLFLALGAYACYALLPFYPHLILALAGIVLFGFGSGCFEPAFNALISHTASPREQGRVQGANQSMQSLSRIIGPFMAATLYQFGWSIPSIISILLSIIGIGILLSNTKKIKAISISINLHGTLQACRREIV
jgi:DHA1 family tetracycline resistance protein-like MFS transporter